MPATARTALVGDRLAEYARDRSRFPAWHNLQNRLCNINIMATEFNDDVTAKRQVVLGPLADMLSFALRRAQGTVGEDVQRSFAGEEIRPMLFSIMLVLKHNPGLRQSLASAALGVKRTNFVPLFDELVERGLAERRQVAGDRRAAALFLTEAGLTLLNRLETVAARSEARFTARLGAEGRTQLLGLLHRLGDSAFDTDADKT
jgi:DNA-binding MarR family transcriptional regulator